MRPAKYLVGLAVLAACGSGRLHAQVVAPAEVTVTLQHGVRSSGPLVTVGDVAVLAGAPALRRRIAAIDLDAFPPHGPKDLHVSREQLAFRLKLAGIPSGWFKIEGAGIVLVTRDGPTQQVSYRPTTPDPAGNAVLVKARDPVRMIARVGGVQVLATGEALQAGRAGEWIRVRNSSSRVEVRGRVVDSGLVEVDH